MILLDANLLLYAKISDFPEHAATRSWLDERLNGPHRVGMPWPSLIAFLRIATSPRVFARPMASREAWAQVEEWLSLSQVWAPEPSEGHPRVLGDLLRATSAVAGDIHDAHLAALAVEHGLVLCTHDRGFAKYPGLRWLDPIAAPAR